MDQYVCISPALSGGPGEERRFSLRSAKVGEEGGLAVPCPGAPSLRGAYMAPNMQEGGENPMSQ